MKLHLARVLPLLLSAWARARAPTAAPLNVSWDPWTNFSFSARQWDHGTCGTYKCYFPELTLASPGHGQAATGERDAEVRKIGWLIESESNKRHQDLSSWMRTWEFAKDLHTRYGAGAKHLLLGPPRRFAIGNSDAALLNAHLWHLGQHKNVSARYAKGNVLVQPVSSCPSSSCVLLGCYRNKLESFRMDLAAFLEQVHDKARFMHALEQNVRSVNTMVRETTCLRTDFQILVRNDGQIFHLDLDRCFAHGRHTWAEDCLDNALALISTISTNNSDWYGRNGSRLLR
jgi:hypothetical protein